MLILILIDAQYYIVCTPPPLFFLGGGGGGGGVNLIPNFQKGWAWQEYLMTKNVYKQKCFSVITKNSDWEFLTKNLVTSQR